MSNSVLYPTSPWLPQPALDCKCHSVAAVRRQIWQNPSFYTTVNSWQANTLLDPETQCLSFSSSCLSPSFFSAIQPHFSRSYVWFFSDMFLPLPLHSSTHFLYDLHSLATWPIHAGPPVFFLLLNKTQQFPHSCDVCAASKASQHHDQLLGGVSLLPWFEGDCCNIDSEATS